MLYTEDWLMRQITQLIFILANLLFGKEIFSQIEIVDEYSSDEYWILIKLAEDGKINQAENLLFSWKEQGIDVKREGLLFYMYLNELSDEALEEGDFSREEIKQGLRDFFQIALYEG